MHENALDFLKYVAKDLDTYYMKGKVLDVGSGDINGNNRWMFPNMDYVGCDVVPGPNVDIVSTCHELSYSDGTFDAIISTECFEHDMHWDKSISKIMKMLKPDGIFVFTCASTGRGEHGTMRCDQRSSLHTQLGDAVWSDYYRNLTSDDIRSIQGFNDRFPDGKFYYNAQSCDLYFVSKSSDVIYENPAVSSC